MTDKLYNLMVSRAAQSKPRDWEKLPAVSGKVYCNVCGGGRDKSGEDFVVAVGFGSASVTCDGSLVIDEQEWTDTYAFDEEEVTLSLVERVALTRPGSDWRISMYGPLSGQEYQRQGAGEWALVHQDDGFA